MYRHFNYFKTFLFAHFKKYKEYKINLYMGLYANFMFMITICLFFKVFTNNFANLIPWTIEEWIFFMINFEFIGLMFGAFWFGRNLKTELIKGEVNNYLTKPINPFLQSLSSYIVSIGIILGLIYGIFLLIYISFFELNYLRFILSIIFSMFGGLFGIIVFNYIDSLAFFFKEIRTVSEAIHDMQRGIEKYPATMFKNSFQFIFAFMPFAYFTSYATHYLFGYLVFEKFLILLLQLISLILIFSIGLIYNWKKGLKRYEAFN